MKYLINNSKIKEIFFNYLNNKAKNNVSRIGSFIIINRELPEDNHEDEPLSIEYDSIDGRLYLNNDFLNELNLFFPFGYEHLTMLIKDWFEEKFKVEVKFVD